MYDQSFSKNSLGYVLQKGDFPNTTYALQQTFKETHLTRAEVIANSNFNNIPNPLTSFNLKKKVVYRLEKLENELVIRKLCENLKHILKLRNQGRAAIVCNLQLLLEEGIPYRVYRLDIKSFYESFSAALVKQEVDDITQLSPQSKKLLSSLLIQHSQIGGIGVPRGLSISSVLSDLMMQDFDLFISSLECVYFYARYVDDIIIISSSQEKQTLFLKAVTSALPSGLELNTKTNKKKIVTAEKRVKSEAIQPQTPLLNFDYLGYSFSVYQPKKINKQKEGAYLRVVTVGIAETKIKKLKTRIIRSFLDFQVTNNWALLHERIKFLTQNFSVYNKKVGNKKLAGIYHSYPQVTIDSKSLKVLDEFLRNAVLSKSGKIFSKTSLKLDGSQKRKLLAQSFVRGHAGQKFIHFRPEKIKEIQQCWLN